MKAVVIRYDTSLDAAIERDIEAFIKYPMICAVLKSFLGPLETLGILPLFFLRDKEELCIRLYGKKTGKKVALTGDAKLCLLYEVFVDVDSNPSLPLHYYGMQINYPVDIFTRTDSGRKIKSDVINLTKKMEAFIFDDNTLTGYLTKAQIKSFADSFSHEGYLSEEEEDD